MGKLRALDRAELANQIQGFKIPDRWDALEKNKNILLDVLVCSIAVYFYESCSILASPKGESKYKWLVKIYSDITHWNV